MRHVVILLSALALSACGPSGPKDYEMSVERATSKLIDANFKRGVLPTYEGLKPKVQRNYAGTLEWQVLDDSENGSGWWCPLEIRKANDEGTKVRVINDCKGAVFARKKTSYLDELVDATLTGREPKFQPES